MTLSPTLNERAHAVADDIVANADVLRVAVHEIGGGRVIDCGIKTDGGLLAGVCLARVCLANLAEVSVVPGEVDGTACPHLQVTTDHPIPACMASQYAGWQIKVEKFFAMGSGPMRAAYGKEELFDHIGFREQSPVAVGVMETRKMPGEAVIAHVAEKLRMAKSDVTLVVAPASSIAGNMQVVARSIETALHKLHELKFDLKQVVSGAGLAPLPPVAANDLQAIGRTNDAILYGGRVTLWVRSDDDLLATVGPKVPSSASTAHGATFMEIFQRAGGDFYKIDPMLFSPAELVVNNLKTGRCHHFGKLAPAVLRKSFFE